MLWWRRSGLRGRPRRIDRGLCPVEGEPTRGGLRKKVSPPSEFRATNGRDPELPRAGRARGAAVVRIRHPYVQHGPRDDLRVPGRTVSVPRHWYLHFAV